MPLSDLIVRTAVLDGGPALDKADLFARLLTLLAEAGHIPQVDGPAAALPHGRGPGRGATGGAAGVVSGAGTPTRAWSPRAAGMAAEHEHPNCLCVPPSYPVR